MTEHGGVSSMLYIVSGRGCDGTWRGEFNVVRFNWSGVTEHGKVSSMLNTILWCNVEIRTC